MICSNCKKQIDDDAKFCNFCGSVISTAENIEEGSVDKYFKLKRDTCEMCGVGGPTKYVEFHQNIGMLFLRNSSSVKGRFCKRCINKYFWKFTFTTLFLGWWGVISAIITPIYILNNIFRYLFTLRLKSSEE